MQERGARGGFEAERLSPLFKPGPAPARAQFHTRRAKPGEPGPKQRRRLHRGGKDAARRTDEHLLPQRAAPVLHLIGAEFGQHGREPVAVIGGGETGGGFGLCHVQAGFSGHQEFAPRRGAGLADRDLPAGGGQHLGRHEPGRACPDHQRVHTAPFRRFACPSGAVLRQRPGQGQRRGIRTWPSCAGHGPDRPPAHRRPDRVRWRRHPRRWHPEGPSPAPCPP